jgi:hypothetical protein
MDREGDQLELLSIMMESGLKFIVRLAHDRRLEPGRGLTEGPKLFESLVSCPFIFERAVQLQPRGKLRSTDKWRPFPPRASRIARLQVRAGTREIFATHDMAAHVPQSLHLQVVEVREVSPPKGEEPIIWRIVTNHPVDSEEQVAFIVDAYRQRWQVEEFFKALKTGCRYQQLQLETLHGLLIALAIHTVVAWRLLLLRWAARHVPHAPARTVLPMAYLPLLQAIAKGSGGLDVPGRELTAGQALHAIARLAGHLVNNGSPGWMLLKRGHDILLNLYRGWVLAQQCSLAPTCDQS